MSALAPTKWTAKMDGVEKECRVYIGLMGQLHGILFAAVGPLYVQLSATTEPKRYRDHQGRKWSLKHKEGKE